MVALRFKFFAQRFSELNADINRIQVIQPRNDILRTCETLSNGFESASATLTPLVLLCGVTFCS
ncbi:hypothetical protein H6F88_03715 [Oculatella sp. FACHB-28]|uniref:hypothetical protein n=1 Tax=Cyanophyceae TaxID=3028117 RepID=UPI001682E1A9|nr:MULTISPECIES: hypothetical protein [Cyanophyceae]MBD1870104.1 hypothetical protein [Cyanobacteria bacterium FACHB-471]MBD1998432.1 hypothetical protein [Leptolyngbya sp. FACHB-541]MBD2055137.1 hypothetical protein [Oculatella sp. FACHB-28]